VIDGEIDIISSDRIETINITSRIEQLIDSEKGIIFLYVPHTTAGIFINESADPDVCLDVNRKLSELVPYGAGYRHMEGNSDSHIKSIIVGNQLFVFFERGKLKLGTWGGIFFAEFDGPRRRKLYYQIRD
jgi:secondary thiamine-phosphate synthase enzyme